MSKKFRKEIDVLGELNVPKDAYWGISTQRAVQNFKISGKVFPKVFLKSLAEVKKASLLANLELGLIEKEHGKAILKAINEILNENKMLDQFPIDIYQTGSGTQTNMNMNEVLANRANELLGYPLGNKYPIHSNDHVNKCQSSNDVIPTAMHLSILHIANDLLIPKILKLNSVLSEKIKEFNGIIKVGRTHLQDAVPIPLSMEFEVYNKQIENSLKRIRQALLELLYIPLGGTALGTGINAHKDFTKIAIKKLSEISGFGFIPNPVMAEGISSHNSIINFSSVLRLLALTLIKMANDIRWMGSGPRAGLSELILPENEPGSSIMPGKINPTQSEALIQVCLQVIGYDNIITFAEGYGSILDLNVCKPLIIHNILESINILGNAIASFIKNCLIGLKPNNQQIEKQLKSMLMVITNLSPIIGYDKCSEIAQKAYKEGKTIKEVILELGIEFEEDIDDLLDPKKML
ncbi:MAG: class II fumarate hydratase [Promethearchaeota archaeon]